uniref:Uncharacterized protein n=1 Tax=Polytomella parva TaxID=51329 RepID=A0A7S0ULL8_9CHLO|mmetsp:Transcript_13335/g.23606  ORF Transcript_13335/g.23606 Transcript_13335/m.23606 type:complete len:322 (+) Transcript_13335:93-1058(+)|eukprot:CAMPEP_0175071946 /NCGR_PEP_ID=MMETSP0052_2-20121109/19581_1 /TAXON_ID=51329 ORGANISM="Polytomella parva, Strain SAG 63-3" /NCGR_SAMPLE_ID=MMETSP0052_2 /ASSEMBLY_ACC=CAM_ASM_000194 /LENGTH=321 /DNA_ID=CAMNT_0016339285 /DNA_START=33 /DNA_END=998 /DNA_ORIENTATION=+
MLAKPNIVNRPALSHRTQLKVAISTRQCAGKKLIARAKPSNDGGNDNSFDFSKYNKNKKQDNYFLESGKNKGFGLGNIFGSSGGSGGGGRSVTKGFGGDDDSEGFNLEAFFAKFFTLENFLSSVRYVYAVFVYNVEIALIFYTYWVCNVLLFWFNEWAATTWSLSDSYGSGVLFDRIRLVFKQVLYWIEDQILGFHEKDHYIPPKRIFYADVAKEIDSEAGILLEDYKYDLSAYERRVLRNAFVFQPHERHGGRPSDLNWDEVKRVLARHRPEIEDAREFQQLQRAGRVKEYWADPAKRQEYEKVTGLKFDDSLLCGEAKP